ncbi:hypothetical protein PYW07_012852 [Mythimna separata]|uniref:Uncharacterized protein n=1 Tax=Mythimna separata TaxID=271217 RepID=A0AAD8DKX7_MYTSE|nr:hypothetical protein PYW07_012852 [Mythimna separata]
MKQHHQNSFQIKSFIKEARIKFHEDTPSPPDNINLHKTAMKTRPPLRVGANLHKTATAHKTLVFKTTNIWSDNSSFMEQLGLVTPDPFFFHHVRGRPSFPYSMTPYTTERNNRHLKWEKIFPGSNLRYGAERSLPLSKQKPKVQRPSPSEPQSSILKNSSRTYSFNSSTSPKSSLREYLSHVLKTSLVSPYNDHMLWLQEVTAYTPMERWLETLVGRTGVTRSYATNHTTQASTTLPKAKTPVQNQHLKTYSSNQPLRVLHQDLPRAQDGEFTIPDVPTPAFFTVNVNGVIHLRMKPDARKDQRRTDGSPGSGVDEGGVKGVGSTAVDVMYKADDYKVPAKWHCPECLCSGPKPNKSDNTPLRNISTTRGNKRQAVGSPPEAPTETALAPDDIRQLVQEAVKKEQADLLTKIIENMKSTMNQQLQPIKDQMENMEKSLAFMNLQYEDLLKEYTASKEIMKELQRENAEMKFLLELEDTKHIKLTEAKDKLGNDRTAQKDKPFVHQEIKENSKTAEIKEDRRNTRKQKIGEGREKDRRRNEKAELIRKIMEGSSYSYSDEEEILRRNFMGALKYGIRS